jgi:hypothetical protein
MRRYRYQCRAIVVAAGIMLPGLIGCQDTFWNGETKKLIAAQQLGSSDIPIPAGFDMDQNSSEDSRAQGLRTVRHVYMGKAEGQLVRAFFRDHMPETRWTLTSDEMHQGQFVMQFEKDLETCEVKVSEVGRGWSSRTKLQIEVTPRRGGGGKPAKPAAAQDK